MRLTFKKTATFALMLVIFLTWLAPIWPYEQALHCSLTVLGLGVLAWFERCYPMSNFDFALVMVFFVIHSIAAHWLYSNVPYDVWFQAVFGQGLNEIMGWTRNHFDRLVHFCYGFCFAPAIIGYAKIKGATQRKTAWLIAICAIMVTSLWYEWFEWLIAATLSPSDAEAYNGQQGDMWDAHKDMLSATIGALIWFFPRQFPRNFK